MIEATIKIKAKTRESLLAEVLEVFNILYTEEELSLTYSKDTTLFNRGKSDSCFELGVEGTEFE